MIFQGTANSSELALLRTALNEHCTESGINISNDAMRAVVASRIFSLFENGVDSLEELKLMLKEDRPQSPI
ncbi:hypothetical protein [Hoeflea sp.]|uniref:hypothetical protein n=1 Tax=Hoeflea sp. TaxID=1940281 RepID=UPI0019BBA996|nr:hypothetical protein [Hoeflea sp.]MBC7282976.1 hypothetical protein [Hoeflea sp.]